MGGSLFYGWFLAGPAGPLTSFVLNVAATIIVPQVHNSSYWHSGPQVVAHYLQEARLTPRISAFNQQVRLSNCHSPGHPLVNFAELCHLFARCY